MRALYLFEFCDQSWIPCGARECLYEIMDACNTGVRSFNRRVAIAVTELARQTKSAQVIELGAGRAPVTSDIAAREPNTEFRLVPCDITPNQAVFRELEKQYPGRVSPIYDPVDITEPHKDAFCDSVLVLAGMMHHVPFELRPSVLKSLSQSRSTIAIFEPLKRSLLSMVLATLSFFPAVLLPILFFRRPGKLRRFLWCWLIPIVPAMFVWDGVVSCLRQWTEAEWRAEFAKLSELTDDVRICSGFNSLEIIWSCHGECVSSPSDGTKR